MAVSKSLLAQSAQLQSSSAKALGTLIKNDSASKRRGSPDKFADVHSVISQPSQKAKAHHITSPNVNSRSVSPKSPADSSLKGHHNRRIRAATPDEEESETPKFVAARLGELRNQRHTSASNMRTQASAPSSPGEANKEPQIRTIGLNSKAVNEDTEHGNQREETKIISPAKASGDSEMLAAQRGELRDERKSLASPTRAQNLVPSSPTTTNKEHQHQTIGNNKAVGSRSVLSHSSPITSNAGLLLKSAVNQNTERRIQRDTSKPVSVVEASSASETPKLVAARLGELQKERRSLVASPRAAKRVPSLPAKASDAEKAASSHVVSGQLGNNKVLTSQSVLSHSTGITSSAGMLLRSLAKQERTLEHERRTDSDCDSLSGGIVGAASEISTKSDLHTSIQAGKKSIDRDGQDGGFMPLIHPDDAEQWNYKHILKHDIHLDQQPMWSSMLCCTRSNTREAEIISRINRPLQSSHLALNAATPEPTCLQQYIGNLATECNVFTQELYGDVLADIE